MNTKAKEFLHKAGDFFKNMSMKVRVILAAVLVLIIGVIAALYIRSANQPYATLLNGLTAADKSAVVSFLEENGLTDYRIEGDDILVRADQESLIMARLMMAGFPQSGSAYEFYTNNVGALTTNSEKDTIWLIAREQKMEATLRRLEGVRDATVAINLGKDQTYVLDDSARMDPTVSITLELENGYTLTNQAAENIRNQALSAVPGVTADNVTIGDTIGNVYSADNIANVSDNSQLKLTLQEYYNNTVRTQVMQALDGIYGRNNVRVAVHTQVDVNRRMVESKEYTQPEGSYDNGGLIGKENVMWVITPDGVEAVGGVPGTSTNADIPLYLEDAIQAAGENTYAQYWTERDNRLNESSEQVEVASFTITDIQVAVSINENGNPNASVNQEALQEHVAMAAGIGGDNPASKVSVLIAPFYEEQAAAAPGGIIDDNVMMYLILGATLLFVILVILITLLRMRSKRKKQEKAAREAEAARFEDDFDDGRGPIMDEVLPGAAIAGTNLVIGPDGQPIPGQAVSGADITQPDFNPEKSLELRKMVRQFVQNNPEIAAQIIKTWMKGGDENGG